MRSRAFGVPVRTEDNYPSLGFAESPPPAIKISLGTVSLVSDDLRAAARVLASKFVRPRNCSPNLFLLHRVSKQAFNCPTIDGSAH